MGGCSGSRKTYGYVKRSGWSVWLIIADTVLCMSIVLGDDECVSGPAFDHLSPRDDGCFVYGVFSHVLGLAWLTHPSSASTFHHERYGKAMLAQADDLSISSSAPLCLVFP